VAVGHLRRQAVVSVEARQVVVSVEAHQVAVSVGVQLSVAEVLVLKVVVLFLLSPVFVAAFTLAVAFTRWLLTHFIQGTQVMSVPLFQSPSFLVVVVSK
jgi:hypothetical protein